jgi:hypothetical protein
MRKRRIIPVDEAWNRKAIHDLFESKRQLRDAKTEEARWHLSMVQYHAHTSLPVAAQVHVIIVGDEVRA